jgi:hypothetical protein
MTGRVVRRLGVAALPTGDPLVARHTNESAHGGDLGGLMFVGACRLRRRVLPDMRHMHIPEAVRASGNTSARPR